MALTKHAEAVFRDIDDRIDEGYEEMDPEEAVEFLEEIVSVVKMKIETVKEENDL